MASKNDGNNFKIYLGHYEKQNCNGPYPFSACIIIFYGVQ